MYVPVPSMDIKNTQDGTEASAEAMAEMAYLTTCFPIINDSNINLSDTFPLSYNDTFVSCIT